MCDSDAFSDAAWEKSDDALFLGAETDAQLSLGFMHDRENIYLRIDRLDKTPNEKDAERIYVSIGDKVYSVLCSDTVSVMCDGEAVECDFKTEKICKCVTDDMGEWGRVSVISIKKPADTPDTVKVYAELDDADDASIVSAGFVGVNKEDTDSWFDVALD